MATAAATATNGPVSKCKSLPTPSQEPVQPATAKGPAILGQLPWESEWRTSGCCNFLQASAAEGISHTSQL